MVRRAIIVRTSQDGKRCIAIDEQNFEEINAFLNSDSRHKNKFADITNILFAGIRNTHLYDKEEPDTKSKGVRAMKFFKGQECPNILSGGYKC